MQADRSRLAPVDGLRGLAATMVMLYHVRADCPGVKAGIFNTVVSQGASGVDLFFVLSGFCLYFPLTKPGSSADWKEFYRRRALRILPPYYGVLSLVILLPFALVPALRMLGLPTVPAVWPSTTQMWTHLTMLQTFFTSTFFGIDGVTWSLGIETQFYLVFPIAVWLAHRYGPRGIGALMFATALYRLGLDRGIHQQLALPGTIQMTSTTLPVAANFFLGRWLEFAVGMLAAGFVRRRPHARIGYLSEIGLLIGVIASFELSSRLPLDPIDGILSPIGEMVAGGAFGVLLLLACTEGSIIGNLLSRKIPVYLGTISYSLYLVHQPIINGIAVATSQLQLQGISDFLLLGSLAVPVSLCAAIASFQLFERPYFSMHARNRREASSHVPTIVPRTPVQSAAEA